MAKPSITEVDGFLAEKISVTKTALAQHGAESMRAKVLGQLGEAFDKAVAGYMDRDGTVLRFVLVIDPPHDRGGK